MIRFLYEWILIAVMLFSTMAVAANPEHSWLRDSEFQRVLDLPLISSSGRDRELRPFLNQLANDREISILLDRRIDPSLLVSASIRNDHFEDGIREIAAQANAEVSIIGDTILIGPPHSVRQLNTRVSLLKESLKASELTPLQQMNLLRERVTQWNDFTVPAELLQQVADKFHITITNPEAVPHDLWAAGVISDGSFIEQFTMLLSQFDLTFEWESGHQIRIVPEQSPLGITVLHQPRGMTVDVAAQKISEALPDVQIQIQGRAIQVVATVEEHQQIAVLTGEKPPRVRATIPIVKDSLASHRYTLQMIRKPFRSLLTLLNQQDLTIDFDENQLSAAGIDLDEKISLEVDQVTAEELLKQACDQVGAAFQIEGRTIHIVAPE